MQVERLQKIIAHAGVASRREAESMILAGRVTVSSQSRNEERVAFIVKYLPDIAHCAALGAVAGL